MVQLRILTGRRAGTEFTARRFPVRLGRAADADICLEEDGVWDRHAELTFDPAAGILLSAQSEALMAVNGQSCREMVLRNGDELEIGALKLRFWIAPTVQSGFRFREWLTWAALALITAGQLYLIYWIAP